MKHSVTKISYNFKPKLNRNHYQIIQQLFSDHSAIFHSFTIDENSEKIYWLILKKLFKKMVQLLTLKKSFFGIFSYTIEHKHSTHLSSNLRWIRLLSFLSVLSQVKKKEIVESYAKFID
jgi:hypothetical protein